MMKLIITLFNQINCDKDYFLNNNILRFYAFEGYLETISAIFKYEQTTILPPKLFFIFKVYVSI